MKWKCSEISISLHPQWRLKTQIIITFNNKIWSKTPIIKLQIRSQTSPSSTKPLSYLVTLKNPPSIPSNQDLKLSVRSSYIYNNSSWSLKLCKWSAAWQTFLYSLNTIPLIYSFFLFRNSSPNFWYRCHRAS